MPPAGRIKATQEVIIVIGDAGGDGGYFVVTPNGLKKVPDNNPESLQAYRTIVKNFAVLKKAVAEQEIVQ